MKRTVRKFYTLVEIMTVIVIAAILFGIGIPAFTTMIQGSNMTVAIRQLSAKMQAARAYAVTNRCKVAVLLPEVVENSESTKKDDCCYSAYRVCIVYKDSTDNKYKFQEWIEDENWKTLPKGVLRKTVTNTIPVYNIDATDIGGKLTNYPAIVCNSKGQLDETSNNPVITLRQGRYVGGNPVYTERNSEGKIICHPIEINQYSGKVTVKDITEEDS